jgi:hypothetical protein
MGAAFTNPLVLSTIIQGALGLTGGILGGDGQELSSFEGQGAIDPATMMKNILGKTEMAYSDARDRASSPINLPSSYVQQPPTFTGGGLPMPIGVSGRDPALDNPALKGMDALGVIGGATTNTTPISRNPRNPPPTAEDFPPGNGNLTGDPMLPYPGFRSLTEGVSEATQGASQPSMPKRRSLGTSSGGYEEAASRGYGASLGDPTDPDTQARGAIDLLMQALGG